MVDNKRKPHELIYKQLKSTLLRHDLISPGEKVVLAVSAGVDSVVLLDLLSELKKEIDFTIHLAHFDHRLRGAQGKEDRQFVESIAKQYGYMVTCDEGAVKNLAQSRNLSIEDAGRKLRYRFLWSVFEKINAHKLATAHHADDQVETMFLHLFRGTGIESLAGIVLKDDKGLIRPLLHVWKDDIRKYAQNYRLAFREDPSNLSTDYFRNKIRLELLPQLEKDYDHGIKNHLLNLSKLAVLQKEYFEKEVGEILQGLVLASESGRYISLDGSELEKYHPYLRNLVLREIVTRLTNGNVGLSYQGTRDISEFIEQAQSGAEYHLPDGLRVVKEYDKLVLRIVDEPHVDKVPSSEIVPGESRILNLGDKKLKVETKVAEIEGLVINGDEFVFSRCFGNRLSDYTQFFDLDCLKLPIHIRQWKAGDRFKPFGMEGIKKVSDLFSDLKIPKSKRIDVAILEDQKDILWVVGCRRSAKAAITDKTTRYIKIDVAFLD